MARPRLLSLISAAGAVIAAVLLTLGLASAAAARAAKVPVALQAKFTRVTTTSGPGTFFASRSYVLVPTGTGDLLINERSGTRRHSVLPAGCSATAMSSSQAALSCANGQDELYDLANGQTTPFTISPTLTCGSGPSCASVYGLGTYWAAIQRPIGNGPIPFVIDYQNLQTGQIVPQPIDQRVAVNLNSAPLTAPVCSPLKVPASYPDEATLTGSLTPIGRGFQIAAASQNFLERCGSSLHLLLGGTRIRSANPGCMYGSCPPPSNGRSIIWEPDTGNRTHPLHGIFVPSLRRFTIKLPPRVATVFDVGLTSKHIFFIDGKGVLWSAPAPTLTTTK